MTVSRGIYASHPRWINDLYTKKTIVRGYVHPYYRHMINAVEGGFGKVYKGKFNFWEVVEVAIKRSNLDSNQGTSEFSKEIKMLSKFRHHHIVSLLGYCKDSSTREMILVYEYMTNESFHHHLHKRKANERNSSPLTWVQRPNICIGFDRALEYLYTGTGVESRVIHHDVKSSNVLLDEKLAAKIFDLGLTRKSDVYAFDVVLLETLCGRLALNFTLDEEPHSLAGWANTALKKAAAQVEQWAMPTWCHMFNSTLIGAARVWFDEIPPERIDSYKDLKATLLAYFMQQKKYVKDPVEIHNIKQKDGETIEDFMERFKVETERMKGAPECMRISRFMHGVNNPELTKRLNEHAPKTLEEMMITTTAFIREEAAAPSKKKGKGYNRFTPLTRTPKEILGAKAGKFQPPPPMATPVEKRSSNKFCDFHNDKRHSTDECMQLKKKIKELVRAGKLSHLIKEIKHGRDQSMIGKKETPAKDKPTTIYMIQSSLSPYDGIIKRPGIREIQAMPSTAHEMLKFLVEGGIVTICSIILIPTECTSVITSSSLSKEERTRPDNFKVALHPDFPDQEVEIRGTLSEKGRIELCSILKKSLEIFACQPSNMKGAPERAKDIQAEVQKLVEAGIMREVYYHDWLSNPVMDCYPLPEIDWKGESLCGYPFKCFLDAYKGYHQIQVAESNEEKTAFHTRQGIQIGQNIEVSIDELVVKSYTEAEMLRDIDETFRTLQKVKMKLNPKKCTFGVAEGVFLGYVVTPDGIKPCPDKTAAVLQLPFLQNQRSPESQWEVGQYSNNKAEYEALISGLRIAAQMGVQNVHVSVDSKLVANQILGTYVSKEKNMVKYLDKVKSLVIGFTNFSISQVPLSKNKKADALSKIASTSFAHLSKHVLVEVLKDKSIKENEVTTVVEEDGLAWITPIVEYLKEGTLPNDKKKASKVKFLIVAMDYFTKWIEAKAVATITGGQVKKFVWDNIVCRFSLSEIGMPTYCTRAEDVVSNDEELRLNLNLLEEPGDFVYRSNDASHAVAGGKLGPK
uniref:Reverse transcriptase domain-containing protein n=1 Tax=Tanacetum cinerariifolium TaxID=118510 RepID=A0A6L2L531_TANCI|nr:reverse transcriptase domain-containing protein [Tanacetum cinerariifolium]